MAHSPQNLPWCYNTRSLRTTPVMPHPPLIKVLKMEITKFELAQRNSSKNHELRSPTPEPEAIEVK